MNQKMKIALMTTSSPSRPKNMSSQAKHVSSKQLTSKPFCALALNGKICATARALQQGKNI